MPYRAVISSELAKLFSVLSNPHRVRIIEELSDGEVCVNTLQELLAISHSAVSQQLAVLRTNRLVVERREGRNVFYRLKDPELAAWVLAGSKFIRPDYDDVEKMMTAIQKANETWGLENKQSHTTKGKVKPTEQVIQSMPNSTNMQLEVFDPAKEAFIVPSTKMDDSVILKFVPGESQDIKHD